MVPVGSRGIISSRQARMRGSPGASGSLSVIPRITRSVPELIARRRNGICSIVAVPFLAQTWTMAGVTPSFRLSRRSRREGNASSQALVSPTVNESPIAATRSTESAPRAQGCCRVGCGNGNTIARSNSGPSSAGAPAPATRSATSATTAPSVSPNATSAAWRRIRRPRPMARNRTPAAGPRQRRPRGSRFIAGAEARRYTPAPWAVSSVGRAADF